MPGHANASPDPARGFRLFGSRVDRLTLRLALGVGLIVIGPLTIGFYALCRHHFDRAIASQQRASELQIRVLEVALRHAMLEQDRELLAEVLAGIGSQHSVRSAMLLDHGGTVRVASDRSLVGTRIARDSPACGVCHSKNPAERGRWTLLERGDQTVLRSVLPIENRKECYGCHSSEARLNGMLVMDTSLADLDAELRGDYRWFVAGTALLALLLLVSIGVLVRRLILRRLGRLGRAARAIAAGNLAERARLDGDDVITALAADFNNMANTMMQLISEVRGQETQLQSVMNSLDDGLVVFDGESRVIACNRSFGRRLGKHPEAVRGLPCAEARAGVLPCCTAGRDCPAARCRATGEVQRAVFPRLGKDGEIDSVEEVYASPVFDEQGQVVRVVEIWRDISERVKEEQHLAEIERLVSLGALASGFSHEVNTPLATVLTCAESVLGRLESGAAVDANSIDAVREHALIIRDQVLRCRRITEQFLRFSRGVPPSIEAIDLREIVARVVALVAPTAREKGIELVQAAEGALPAVRANSEVAQHVVLNLLINALQSFDGVRGKVEISFRTDDAVRLRVRDDGCGIPPAHRVHLFEPFRSRKVGGTGLGLFLSRTFMRRFGGDVRLLDSQVGNGSCFEVVFAAASED